MKAIALCAGYGRRLAHLTEELPKPMLPIAGQPLLAYTLRYLGHYGFGQIAINLHYKPESITSYVGDGARFGVRVYYSYEEVLLGTAGAVKKLESFFADAGDFLVLYGDLLIDQDLAVMLDFHREKGASATLLLHQRAGSNSLVRMDRAGRITDFVERPSQEQRLAAPYPWTNSGVYILNSRMMERIPAGRSVDFPQDIFPQMLSEERIFGFPLTGYRCAMDSPARYREACAAVERGIYSGPYPSTGEEEALLDAASSAQDGSRESNEVAG